MKGILRSFDSLTLSLTPDMFDELKKYFIKPTVSVPHLMHLHAFAISCHSDILDSPLYPQIKNCIYSFHKLGIEDVHTLTCNSDPTTLSLVNKHFGPTAVLTVDQMMEKHPHAPKYRMQIMDSNIKHRDTDVCYIKIFNGEKDLLGVVFGSNVRNKLAEFAETYRNQSSVVKPAIINSLMVRYIKRNKLGKFKNLTIDKSKVNYVTLEIEMNDEKSINSLKQFILDNIDLPPELVISKQDNTSLVKIIGSLDAGGLCSMALHFKALILDGQNLNPNFLKTIKKCKEFTVKYLGFSICCVTIDGKDYLMVGQSNNLRDRLNFEKNIK